MTPEEIQALKEAKEAAETRAAAAEAAALAAKSTAEEVASKLNNVVEELKEERRKKNEALEKQNINQPPSQNLDVAQLIEQELQKKEQERLKRDFETAIEEFKASKTEFQADQAGLVFDKFKQQMTKFNFSDVSTKEQAKARLEEIYRFTNFKGNNEAAQQYEGSPQYSPTPRSLDGQLSAETAKVLEESGVQKEKFEALAKKYPDALTSLGIGG